MIVLKDQILQKELNNFTSIFLNHGYELHLISKNMKKTLYLLEVIIYHNG